MNIIRSGYVYIRNEYCGIVNETDEGYTFSYDEDYFKKETNSPISLTLPLSKKTYKSHTLFSFFDGLIPEGWLLDVVSRNWKIDPNDRFKLLLVSCKDPIGNIKVLEEKI